MVGDTVGHDGPSTANGKTSVMLKVFGNGMKTQVSAITMLAPTPDYYTGFNNEELCYNGHWIYYRYGPLYAYDAGTEKVIGTDQQPRQNTAEIIGTPFYGRQVGYYSIVQV